MNRKKFAEAILRFDYEEAERILREANIVGDEKAVVTLFRTVGWNRDKNGEHLFPNLPNGSILGISLIGFLAYLKEHGYAKALLYDSAVSLLIGSLCHIAGAYELALYYQFKLMQEENCVAHLCTMITYFYDYPGTLVDEKTVVYAAQKVIEVNPGDETALWVMKEIAPKIDDVDRSETMFAAPFGTADIDNDAINYEEFESRVYKVKYADAAAILSHPDLDEQTRQDWLLSATVWNDGDQHYGGDLSVYGFLMYLLDEGWDKARVYRWLVLTLNASDSIDGAYGLALYYCRKLVAEEETLENLRLLLSFVDAPGNFLGDDEAVDVARRILALDANDAKAREVLELVGGTG